MSKKKREERKNKSKSQTIISLSKERSLPLCVSSLAKGEGTPSFA
jgi:hypothetical protein